jgi:hypothetical protein
MVKWANLIPGPMREILQYFCGVGVGGIDNSEYLYTHNAVRVVATYSLVSRYQFF